MPLRVSVLEALPQARRVMELLEPVSRSFDCSFDWEPLPEPLEAEWHSAVDGGSRVISLHDEDVFIVKGWSGWWPGGGESYYSAVGPVVPAPDAEHRVPVYREIVEYRVALEAARSAEPGGLLLFDGSASTAVKWWRHSQGREERRLREAPANLERYAGSSLDELAVKVLGGEELPFSYWLSIRLASEGRGGGLEWMPGVEMLEKLLLLKHALEQAWSRGALTAFIAKTVRGTKLCGGPRSDVYYLERMAPQEPGMVAPGWPGSEAHGAPAITGIRGGAAHFRQVFPEELGIRDFYLNRIASAETYVRLAPGGPMFLVSVIYDAASEGDPQGLLRRVIALLAGLPLSRDGYPVPLQIAHVKALVRGEEERAALRLLEERRPGRAILNM